MSNYVLPKTGDEIRDIIENFDASTDSEEVLSDKKLYAPEVRSKTGTFYLDDSVGIKANSTGIETVDLARGTFNVVTMSEYDPNGSSRPFYREMGGHITKDIYTQEGNTSGSFGVTIPVFEIPTRDGIHLERLIIKPAADGVGTLSLFYGDTSAGTRLVSSMTFEIQPYQVGTEVSVPLDNPSTLYNGENLFWEYTGPALYGDYDSVIFTPYSKAVEHEFVEKQLALVDDLDAKIDHISAYLSTDKNLTDSEDAIDFDTVSSSSGITMSINGEFVVSNGGLFGGELRMFIDQGGKPEIYIWIESKVLPTDPWVPKNSHMVKSKFEVDTTETLSIPACVVFQSGETFRIMTKKKGGPSTAVLEKQSESLSGATLVQESASVCLHRIGGV